MGIAGKSLYDSNNMEQIPFYLNDFQKKPGFFDIKME